jgi:hypothetical protein
LRVQVKTPARVAGAKQLLNFITRKFDTLVRMTRV